MYHQMFVAWQAMNGSSLQQEAWAAKHGVIRSRMRQFVSTAVSGPPHSYLYPRIRILTFILAFAFLSVITSTLLLLSIITTTLTLTHYHFYPLTLVYYHTYPLTFNYFLYLLPLIYHLYPYPSTLNYVLYLLLLPLTYHLYLYPSTLMSCRHVMSCHSKGPFSGAYC